MKYALVTGASGGIGRAVTEAFAEEGYTVFAQWFRHKEEPEELAERYSNVIPVWADLADASSVRAMFETIAQTADALDVLVNNAGVAYFGLLQDMSEEDWDHVFSVNLKGAFLCAREALPGMIRRGEGAILNISSMWGEKGASCEVAYSASKGGLNAFTKALAKELGPSGIRVNALACGVIDTRMNARLNEQEREELKEEIGLMRFGTPREAAEAAVWLCSEKAAYISGSIVDLDGCFR